MLFRSISKYALLNGLSIINLKKSEPVAVNGPELTQQTTESSTDQNTTTENPEGQQVMYYFQLIVLWFVV